MIDWKIENEYLFGKTNKFKYQSKIASFDLDGTITITKSKKKFPTSAEDWEFYDKKVPIKLKELTEIGYCFIIVSNQGGLKGIAKKNEWMTKINAIQKILNLEMLVFCSTSDNEFRKPLPMFFFNGTFFPQNIYDTKSKESFYCGDACGRKGDHSDTDLKFAINCGLEFKTPEMLFMNDKSKIPKILYPDIKTVLDTKCDLKFKRNVNQEIIIMIGYPASGKSSIAEYLENKFNYVIINQDILKTKTKCLKFAKENLLQNKSIIIDNTNRDKKTRSEWINLANNFNCDVRAIYLNVLPNLAMHNNIYRYLKTGKYISKIVYNIYSSTHETPEIEEGFKDIIVVNGGFKNNQFDEQIYQMYMY